MKPHTLATCAHRARASTLFLAAGVVAGIAAPSVSLVAQTPPDTFRLGDIVVTATRLPTRITEAPGAVTVLTADELRVRGTRYVIDALRVVPGVAIAQSGGPGALTSVFIRGGESDYVQVLVDGVQVNEPGGSFDWAHLRTEDIERIEIVRGPVSVLYGSDAVSGVVHIITKAGGAPRVEVGASAGRGERPAADGTHRTDAIDASLTGALTRRDLAFRYGASVAHHVSNGLYAFNSEYDNTNLSARASLAARDVDLNVNVRRGEHEYHYPTSGSGAVVDENQFATGTATVLGAEAGWKLHRALELRVQAGSYARDGRTENPPDNEGSGSFWSTSDATRRSLDARVNAGLPHDLVLTVGAVHERQHGTTAFESVSDFGTFSDETDDRRRNTGYYAQLHGPLGAGFTITAGARLDDNDAFGTFRTGRLALSRAFGTAGRIHAAFGNAFKEPTFFENYATGFVRGNAELEPEQSRSWEFGGEHAIATGLTVGATWFDQRFTNLIQYTGQPVTSTDPNYYNVGRATSRGIEFSLRGELDRVTLRGGYTWTRTRVTEPGYGGDRAFTDGEPLVRRPAHQASASADWRATDAIRAMLDVLHTGERDDLDFTNPAEWQGLRTALPAHTTVDIGGTYALRERVELSLRVRNAFDARYDGIYNFPAAGRVIALGLRAGLGR